MGSSSERARRLGCRRPAGASACSPSRGRLPRRARALPRRERGGPGGDAGTASSRSTRDRRIVGLHARGFGSVHRQRHAQDPRSRATPGARHRSGGARARAPGDPPRIRESAGDVPPGPGAGRGRNRQRRPPRDLLFVRWCDRPWPACPRRATSSGCSLSFCSPRTCSDVRIQARSTPHVIARTGCIPRPVGGSQRGVASLQCGAHVLWRKSNDRTAPSVPTPGRAQ